MQLLKEMKSEMIRDRLQRGDIVFEKSGTETLRYYALDKYGILCLYSWNKKEKEPKLEIYNAVLDIGRHSSEYYAPFFVDEKSHAQYLINETKSYKAVNGKKVTIGTIETTKNVAYGIVEGECTIREYKLTGETTDPAFNIIDIWCYMDEKFFGEATSTDIKAFYEQLIKYI